MLPSRLAQIHPQNPTEIEVGLHHRLTGRRCSLLAGGWLKSDMTPSGIRYGPLPQGLFRLDVFVNRPVGQVVTMSVVSNFISTWVLFTP